MPQPFARAYQRPLPGLEHLGDPTLPVGHIFPHPEIAKHPNEYHAVTFYNPTKTKVRTSSLRPTQPHVDEPYLYEENRGSHDHPGAIKDGSGRYRLVDGHHKVARALLNGDQFMDVQVWDSKGMP